MNTLCVGLLAEQPYLAASSAHYREGSPSLQLGSIGVRQLCPCQVIIVSSMGMYWSMMMDVLPLQVISCLNRVSKVKYFSAFRIEPTC